MATTQHTAAKQWHHQHRHGAFICTAHTSLHEAAACSGEVAGLAHTTVWSFSHNRAPLLSRLPRFPSQHGRGEVTTSLQDLLTLLQGMVIAA